MEKGMCKQGVYVKHLVNGTEGLVIGKVIWMFGCEKMVMMPKDFNPNGILDNFAQRRMASEEYLELTGEESPFERDFPIPNTEKWFGKKCRDKVTGIEGICIACMEALFSADQYCLEWKGKKGRPQQDWFDEGRLEIIDDGITAGEVSSSSPGGSDLELPMYCLPSEIVLFD